ncbi:MAG: hypothetical protein R6U32_06200 [Candidatus Woesearchaeota archaeon]
MLEKYALWKVVEALTNPENEFSVREMARTAKISPSASKACLDYLYNNGLLRKKVIGNVYQYSLDTGNPIARQVRNTIIIKNFMDSCPQKPGSRSCLCSSAEGAEILTTGPAEKTKGLTIRKVSRDEFDSLKRSYDDVITIQ